MNSQNAISAWGTAPNDTAGREQVIDRAGGSRSQFSAKPLRASVDVATQVEAGAQSAVSSINAIAAQIRDLNPAAPPRGCRTIPASTPRCTQLWKSFPPTLASPLLTQPDGAVSVTLEGRISAGNRRERERAFNRRCFPRGLQIRRFPSSIGTEMMLRLSFQVANWLACSACETRLSPR